MLSHCSVLNMCLQISPGVSSSFMLISLTLHVKILAFLSGLLGKRSTSESVHHVTSCTGLFCSCNGNEKCVVQTVMHLYIDK